VSFSAIADAQNATERIYGVFEAEQLAETKVVRPDLEHAIEVEGGEFTWDGPPPEDKKKGKEKARGLKGLGRALKARKNKDRMKGAETPGDVTPAVDGAGTATPALVEKDKGEVFRLRGIDMTVPRGKLVAIVGPVGSGKTSLLEGLIGEMRKTKGEVKFGGSVGYCPQSAWIQVRGLPWGSCFYDGRALMVWLCAERDDQGERVLWEAVRGGAVLEGGEGQLSRARFGDSAQRGFDRGWREG
jgi:ATPase subunit of ABC transporter with duplicated ATPase domains